MAKSILIITPGYLPLLGGMEQQVHLLAKEFLNLGHRVTIVSERTKAEFPQQETDAGIMIIRLKTSSYRVLAYIFLFFQLSLFLLRFGNSFSFIIVRTLTYPAVVVGLFKYLGIIHVPTLATAETGGDHDDVRAIGQYPFSFLLVKLLSAHTYLNALCEANVTHYKELNVPERKILTIPNGVDTAPFTKLHYPQKVLNFLYLGQLVSEKGIWELLHAFEKLRLNYPSSKLYVAGAGLEADAIQEFIDTHSLQGNICYLGRIPQSKLNWFFEHGECLVLPSYSEAMPLVVLEAIVRKKLVLCTDVGSIRQLLGNQAYYCEIKDIESVLKQMKKVLELKKVSLDYEHILKNIDIKNTAKQFIERSCLLSAD